MINISGSKQNEFIFNLNGSKSKFWVWVGWVIGSRSKSLSGYISFMFNLTISNKKLNRRGKESYFHPRKP